VLIQALLFFWQVARRALGRRCNAVKIEQAKGVSSRLLELTQVSSTTTTTRPRFSARISSPKLSFVRSGCGVRL
jgi:PHP family Zn ribbon phosphoesterase